jgi:hypothetical protein
LPTSCPSYGAKDILFVLEILRKLARQKNCLQYGTKVVNGMELERIPDNLGTVLKEIKCEKMLMSEKTCFIICISSKVTHKLT